MRGRNVQNPGGVKHLHRFVNRNTMLLKNNYHKLPRYGGRRSSHQNLRSCGKDLDRTGLIQRIPPAGRGAAANFSRNTLEAYPISFDPPVEALRLQVEINRKFYNPSFFHKLMSRFLSQTRSYSRVQVDLQVTSWPPSAVAQFAHPNAFSIGLSRCTRQSLVIARGLGRKPGYLERFGRLLHMIYVTAQG